LSGEKSQNQETSFGQKEMRKIKGSWLSPIVFPDLVSSLKKEELKHFLVLKN